MFPSHDPREVPSYARSYDPTSRAWTVSQPYIATAGALVESVFPDVEVEDHSVHFDPPQSDNRSSNEYKTLHLLPTAPPELVESAYKCLSRLYHPDRGGDPERMVAINSAVETIRRRLA